MAPFYTYSLLCSYNPSLDTHNPGVTTKNLTIVWQQILEYRCEIIIEKGMNKFVN